MYCIMLQLKKIVKETSAEKLRLYMKTILVGTKQKLFIYALIKGELNVIPFNTSIVKKNWTS